MSFNIVSTTASDTDSGASYDAVTATIPATTAGNTLIVFWIDGGEAPSSAATCTDSHGSTYTKGFSGNTSEGACYCVFATSDIVAGITSVTATATTEFNDRIGIVVLEVSGCTATFDTTAAQSALTFYSELSSTGAITTTNATDVVFGLVGDNGNGTITSSNSTIIGSYFGDSDVLYLLSIMYMTTTTTGSYNPAFTVTSGNSIITATVSLELSSSPPPSYITQTGYFLVGM